MNTANGYPNFPKRNNFFLQSSYAFGYILLSASSTELSILGDIISDLIFLKKKDTISVLDIGCGDGQLTSLYAEKAQRIEFYEPNPILYSIAKSKVKPDGDRLILPRNEVFPLTRTEEITYHDIALASHVLYHIKQQNWEKFFNAIFHKLKFQGSLILSLWNEDSEAFKITREITPHRWLVTANSFENDFLSRTPSLHIDETIKIHPRIATHSIEAARVILHFLAGIHIRKNTRYSQELLKALLSKDGLDNSQTIYVFSRR